MCAWGEIGLGGEVRGVSSSERRAVEASRLGFTDCALPRAGIERLGNLKGDVNLRGVANLRDAVETWLPGALRDGGNNAAERPRRESGKGKKGGSMKDSQDRVAQIRARGARENDDGEDAFEPEM